MRVLVTGGAGFIGRHFVLRLLAEGHDVLAYDALVPQVHGEGAGWPADLAAISAETPERLRLWQSDVRDVGEMRRALASFQPEAIVHLAAFVGVGQAEMQIAAYESVNVGGTAVTVQEAIRFDRAIPGVLRRFVIAGSMSIYGEAGEDEVEDGVNFSWSAEHAPGVYAWTKLQQEELLGRTARHMPTVDCVSLRFFNVYGDGQSLGNPYTGVAAIFATRLANGEAPIIYGNGTQARSFIHVSDVVDAVYRATLNDLDHTQPAFSSEYLTISDAAWDRRRFGPNGGSFVTSPDGESFITVLDVGHPEHLTINDVAEILRAELAPNLAPIEPSGLKRVGDIHTCFACKYTIKRTSEVLGGWIPKVDPVTGLAAYGRWVASQAVPPSLQEQAHAELVSAGLVSAPPGEV
jgi:dTDP-L-rhamnose 4-epimerase